MKYRRFEELPVWNDAADLTCLIFEFTTVDRFGRHPGLRNQLEGATLSVSNNIAEGFERGSTKELLAFLYISRGSAGEVRSILKILEKWNAFSDRKSQISDLTNKCEKISRQLYGWIEQLKKSGISGRRHLNKKARIVLKKHSDPEQFPNE
jgi:four helix bundle protein